MKHPNSRHPVKITSDGQAELRSMGVGPTQLGLAAGITKQLASRILRLGESPSTEVQLAVLKAFGIPDVWWRLALGKSERGRGQRAQQSDEQVDEPAHVDEPATWRSQGAAALFLAAHPDDALFKAPRLWKTEPEAVAEACGVAPGVVTAWVLGRAEPSPVEARRLEAHVYLPAEWWGEPGPEGEAALATLALFMGLRAPTRRGAAYFEREHGIARDAWKQPARPPRHAGVPL